LATTKITKITKANDQTRSLDSPSLCLIESDRSRRYDSDASGTFFEILPRELVDPVAEFLPDYEYGEVGFVIVQCVIERTIEEQEVA
jgi:hypothetical protein